MRNLNEPVLAKFVWMVNFQCISTELLLLFVICVSASEQIEGDQQRKSFCEKLRLVSLLRKYIRRFPRSTKLFGTIKKKILC